MEAWDSSVVQMHVSVLQPVRTLWSGGEEPGLCLPPKALSFHLCVALGNLYNLSIDYCLVFKMWEMRSPLQGNCED